MSTKLHRLAKTRATRSACDKCLFFVAVGFDVRRHLDSSAPPDCPHRYDDWTRIYVTLVSEGGPPARLFGAWYSLKELRDIREIETQNDCKQSLTAAEYPPAHKPVRQFHQKPPAAPVGLDKEGSGFGAS